VSAAPWTIRIGRGLVSREAATNSYGVVFDDDQAVNVGQSAALRERMANQRGEVALFDRGGTIEDLRARCKEETGLDPPKAPIFLNWFFEDKQGGAG